MVDGEWRDYGTVQWPDAARGGLLFQDPAALQPALDTLGGYAAGGQTFRDDWLAATLPAAMDPQTGMVRWSRPSVSRPPMSG